MSKREGAADSQMGREIQDIAQRTQDQILDLRSRIAALQLAVDSNLANIEKEVDQPSKQNISTIATTVQNLQNSLEHEEDLRMMKSMQDQVFAQISQEDPGTKTNQETREWNLLFHGIQEEADEKCEAVFRRFLLEDLHLPQPQVEGMSILEVGRQPRTQKELPPGGSQRALIEETPGPAPRVIIATFGKMEHRDLVFQTAKKLKDMGEIVLKDIRMEKIQKPPVCVFCEKFKPFLGNTLGEVKKDQEASENESISTYIPTILTGTPKHVLPLNEAATKFVEEHFSEWNSKSYFVPYVYFLEDTFVTKELGNEKTNDKVSSADNPKEEPNEKGKREDVAAKSEKNKRKKENDNVIRAKLAVRSVHAPLKALLQKEETTSLTVHEYDFQKSFGEQIGKEKKKKLGLEGLSLNGEHDLFSVLMAGDSIYNIFIQVKATGCESNAKTIRKTLQKALEQLERDLRIFCALNEEVRGENVFVFGFPAFPFLTRAQAQQYIGCISCARNIITQDDILGRTPIERSENLKKFLKEHGIVFRHRTPDKSETEKMYESIFTRYVSSSYAIEYESVSCLSRLGKQMKSILAFLTPEQQEALACPEKYVALLGDYGTGKTWILQNRLKKLLKEGASSPWKTCFYIINCARDKSDSPSSALTDRFASFISNHSQNPDVHVLDVWDFLKQQKKTTTAANMECREFYEELEEAIILAALNEKGDEKKEKVKEEKIVHFLIDEFRIPDENINIDWSPWEKSEESKKPDSIWIACRPSREGGWSFRGREDKAFPQSKNIHEKFLTKRRRATTYISEFYEYEYMEDAGIDTQTGNVSAMYTEHPKTVYGTEPEIMEYPIVEDFCDTGDYDEDSAKIFQIALGMKNIRDHLASVKENLEYFPIIAIAHLSEEILLDIHRCITEFLKSPCKYITSKGEILGDAKADIQLHHQEAFRGCEASFVILIEDRGYASQYYHGSIMRATTHLFILDDPESPRESIYKAAKHVVVKKLKCKVTDSDKVAFSAFSDFLSRQ